MRSYLARIALFAFIAVAVNACILAYLEAKHPPSAFMAGYATKKRAMQNTPGPRLLLIGGSAGVFGVLHDTLAARCPFPIVNACLQAGHGLRFQLNDAIDDVHQGDIVAVLAEYSNFYGCYDGDTQLFPLLFAYPESRAAIRTTGQWRFLLGKFPGYLNWLYQNALSDAIKGPRKAGKWNTLYTVHPYNKAMETSNADTIPMRNRLQDMVAYPMTEYDPRAVEGLAAFVRALEGKARVLVIYPPIPVEMYRLNAAQIARVHGDLTRALPGCIPYPPSAAVYDVSLFLDNVYHLNLKGRRVYSTLVAASILRSDYFSRTTGRALLPSAERATQR